MDQAAFSLLAHWANFYVITGSAAGALTGVQFVVITLIAQTELAGSMREISAFGTPTVVQFCASILIAAAMVVPWSTLAHLAVCFVIFGVLGFAYSCRALHHARKQEGYQPDVEDWTWYTGLPMLSYALLLAAGILLWFHPFLALKLIAADALAFLFIGIHNAWDTVTFVAVKHRQTRRERAQQRREQTPNS